MGQPVVTVATGGLPVVDATTLGRGTPVTEDANLRGVAVTKVATYGIPVCYETFGIAPSAPVLTTFAAFDLASATNTSLSNGNLTATHTNITSSSGARVVTPLLSSGKYYFEIKLLVGNGTNDKMGLTKSVASFADMTLGNANTVLAVFRPTGNAYNVNGVSSTKLVNAFAANDVLCVAVDLTNGLVWCRKNAGNWNADVTANPATATGGVSFTSSACAPYVGFGGSGTAANDAYTANFGQSAFAFTAPAGFSLGWGV